MKNPQEAALVADGMKESNWKDRALAFILELSGDESDFLHQMLRLIAKHFGYPCLLFFPYGAAGHIAAHPAARGNLNNFIAYNIDYKHLTQYAKFSYRHNPLSPANLAAEHRAEKVLTLDSLMDAREYEQSKWHKILQMIGMYHHACIHFPCRQHTAQTASLNIFRPRESGAFAGWELELFAYLSDYLSNRFHSYLQQSGDAEMSRHIETVFKTLTLGAVFLDDQMAVINANAAARSICKQYLRDFSSQTMNRSAFYIDESNIDVQRVIDEIGVELFNGKDVYHLETSNKARYSFYPSSSVSYGAAGFFSVRYSVFIQKEELRGEEDFVLPEPLTKRESEILRHVRAGRNNEQISKDLNISIYTVRTHISNLYQKFGVGTRVELLMKLM